MNKKLSPPKQQYKAAYTVYRSFGESGVDGMEIAIETEYAHAAYISYAQRDDNASGWVDRFREEMWYQRNIEINPSFGIPF